jgi:hypothetical protein
MAYSFGGICRPLNDGYTTIARSVSSLLAAYRRINGFIFFIGLKRYGQYLFVGVQVLTIV